MTSKSMRSFAGGIILATSICGAVYFSGPSEVKSTQTVVKVKQPSELEMKNMLLSKGYVIHTEEEWKKQQAASAKAKSSTKAASPNKVEYRTIITVSKGMTSIDVEKALKRAKIIDKKIKFSKEVEKRGLENDLRPGSYNVKSGMKMNELIKAIFK